MPIGRALTLPLACAAALLGSAFSPGVWQAAGLRWALLGAGTVLIAWSLLLYVAGRRKRRTLALEMAPRRQHYLQACAQAAILIYWGWYWREVYGFALLIAAQLVFAYAFDALLTWSRRDTYLLGFGPFPVIFSINLFLWFRADWFYLQFLMIALGFAAKELIRWNKGGQRVHIFNPSSFPLAVFSVVLIATGSTHMTWGEQIATTQLIPPQIYLLIFAVSLPGQLLFGVASMTLAAVATTYAFGLAYAAATGTYFFLEPSVPIAVFLGMHLLFTDPSTSPRTELGRLMFGVLYGLSVVALFAALERAGVPSFYDKLLSVPVLNLMVQGLDAFSRSPVLRAVDPAALGRALSPGQRHLRYMAIWALFFIVMQMQTSTDVTLARGDVLLSLGRVEEATARFQQVVRADENHAVGHAKLGLALSTAGRFEEALPALRRAADLRPDLPDSHINLGSALLQTGQIAAAVPALERAIELRPDYAEARYNLAQAHAALGQPGAAVSELRTALEQRPDWPPALEALAWVQATEADPEVRNPEEAVRLASMAVALSDRRQPSALDVLAAAYAAAGRFVEATETAEAAEALAATSSPALAADIRRRLGFYRAGQPLVVSDASR